MTIEVTIQLDFRVEVSVKDGSVIMEDISEISFSLSELIIRFENLFRGKAPDYKLIAETVDWLLNQNTEAFIEEFHSVIRSSVADLLKD